LASLRKSGNSGRDIHGDATDVFASDLNFSGVNAAPHFNPEWLDGFSNGLRTANTPSRAVEGGKKAVAQSLDLAAAVARELLSHNPIVLADHLDPTPIAEIRCSLGGIHDVGKHQCHQNPVQLRHRSRSGEKFLDLVDNSVNVPDPRRMIDPWHFHIPSVRNLAGHISPRAGFQAAITCALNHQCWDLNGR
jgi:hypothetical protein